MEFYVDIADLESIKKVAEYYPIDGFTTNPKILTKEAGKVEELIPQYREFAEKNDVKVFFQVTVE